VRDIAAVAVKALTEDGHAQQSYDLTGPEALSYDEVARLFTEVLGREIVYANPSVLAFAKRMRRQGYPVGFIGVTSALYTIACLGLAARVAKEVVRVLGRSPISFRQYVQDYKNCWTQGDRR
jgi:uncharacterized protein YbjT (DUF2867 family)